MSRFQYDGVGIVSDQGKNSKYWGVAPINKDNSAWTVRFMDRVNKEIVKFKPVGTSLSEEQAAGIAVVFFQNPNLYALSEESFQVTFSCGTVFQINACANTIKEVKVETFDGGDKIARQPVIAKSSKKQVLTRAQQLIAEAMAIGYQRVNERKYA